MGAGRPTDYRDEYIEQAYKLCLLGYTDEDLAEFWDVCVATINNWKREHPEFLASIKKGKEEADYNVVDSLYNRAKGYKHKEQKLIFKNGEPETFDIEKHYPPDTAAIIYWLNNRQRKRWSNKAYHEDDKPKDDKPILEQGQELPEDE